MFGSKVAENLIFSKVFWFINYGIYIFISIINRDEHEGANVTIDGVDPGGEVYLVSGSSPLATNTFNDTSNVTIKKGHWSSTEKSLSIPPHSFAMVIIHGKETVE